MPPAQVASRFCIDAARRARASEDLLTLFFPQEPNLRTSPLPVPLAIEPNPPNRKYSRHTHIYIYIYIHIYTHIYIYMLCVSIYIYIYIFVCEYVFMYISTRTQYKGPVRNLSYKRVGVVFSRGTD